jgi:hypothetical protein
VFTAVAGIIASFLFGATSLINVCRGSVVFVEHVWLCTPVTPCSPSTFVLIEFIVAVLATIFYLAASIVVSSGFQGLCSDITPKRGSCSSILNSFVVLLRRFFPQSMQGWIHKWLRQAIQPAHVDRGRRMVFNCLLPSPLITAVQPIPCFTWSTAGTTTAQEAGQAGAHRPSDLRGVAHVPTDD